MDATALGKNEDFLNLSFMRLSILQIVHSNINFYIVLEWMGPDEKPNQSVRKVKANHGLGLKPLVLFHSKYFCFKLA